MKIPDPPATSTAAESPYMEAANEPPDASLANAVLQASAARERSLQKLRERIAAVLCDGASFEGEPQEQLAASAISA